MELISNEEVIAINQDASNTGGDRIFNGTLGNQVWSRPLANGDKCVVLYNSGVSKKSLNVGITWGMVGWDEQSVVHIRDLWGKKNLGNFTLGYNASVGPRDIQMLRLKRISSP